MAGNTTTMFNTITLPEMTDLVRREWVTTKQFLPRKARELFIVDNIGTGKGDTKKYTEIDTETFADSKPEGTNFTKTRAAIGYDVTMTAKSFGKEAEITVEMRNNNRYLEIGAMLTSLSQFCENRMELDLTHRLTFAGSTSYTNKNGETVTTTVGDGKALVAADHTLSASSTTYSNLVAGAPAFSQGAFEAAMILAKTQVYSNLGELRDMEFNTIISSSLDMATTRAIRQMLESTADVDAAQAGVKNVYGGVMKHVALPYLATTAAGAYDSTKKRYWFVASTGLGVNGWQAYLGEWVAPKLNTPSVGSNAEDVHNLNWTYSAYTQYGICTVSPKGIVGSLVVS